MLSLFYELLTKIELKVKIMDNFSEDEENVTNILRGMENIYVDTTSISLVDGQEGKLYYRGINVAELVAHSTFEETSWLLLNGNLPTNSELTSFKLELKTLQHTHDKIFRIISEFPLSSSPLLLLQFCLSALSSLENADNYLGQTGMERFIKVIAQTPVIVSAAYRHSLGRPFLEPRSDLGFVENFMYMFSGNFPTKKQAKCLETALVLLMDHGFNTSTFAARTVASTGANLYAVISAAAGALSGPLHGGAGEHVIQLLAEVRQFNDVKKYVHDLLSSGGKIVGMGHRIYKTSDPRAEIFKDLLFRITPEGEKNSDYLLLCQIEQEARNYFRSREKPIYSNVDFWSGAVYKRLGILPTMYSSILAVARVVGWCAHILELSEDNRLYRPRSIYKGKINQPFIPLELRGF